MTFRAARWPEDLGPLTRLDTSFVTDRIYQVVCGELGFTLVEEPVNPPLRKSYGDVTLDERLTSLPCAVVAEDGGVRAGFAAAEVTVWNRRAALWHLYVAAEYRGRGVGTALLARIEEYARETGARCLWVETQNTNYPAVRFYRKAGFRLCGLDLSLYDPAGPAAGEVALFLCRDIADG